MSTLPKGKRPDAPSFADVQALALGQGYAVRVDRDGFNLRNVNTGAEQIVGSVDDVIEIVTRKTL